MLKAFAAALPLEEPTIFPPPIVAGVTLRAAERFPPRGFSVDAFSTPSAETELLAAMLGVRLEALKFQYQVHGSRIRWIEAESLPQESDGMITATPNLFLCVRIADCCAVLIASPEPLMVAALHAGWRGIAAGIVEAGVEELLRKGCRPDRLLVYLSPCASVHSYTVRQDVAALFPESAYRIDEESFRLDLRGEIRLRLLRLGIRHEAIESSPGCTIRDSCYHSFRRDGAAAGRMVAFIGIALARSPLNEQECRRE